ncbi:MAG: pantetheine-phosphate adenylyltransferase [Eubacteriales bacterium]
MSICIYPGSFDPITMGHLDIITRGSEMFDTVIVCVLVNTQKTPAFSLQKRLSMIRESVKHLNNVSVDSFSGLLVDYMEQKKADIILRGLRAVSDFEHEFAMAAMNHQLKPEVETVFLMTRTKYSFLSSSVIREVAGFGGDVSGLVPDAILDDIKHLKK